MKIKTISSICFVILISIILAYSCQLIHWIHLEDEEEGTTPTTYQNGDNGTSSTTTTTLKPLNEPSILQIDRKANNVTISWDDIDNDLDDVDSYKVQRSDTSDGIYTKVATTGDTTITIDDLDAGTRDFSDSMPSGAVDTTITPSSL